MKLQEVFDGAGKPFAYYPNLAKAFDSVTAAVYFCNLVWRDSDRCQECEGDAFIKTQNQICDETGLTFKQAKSAKARLDELEVVECQYDRLNHRSRLTINWEKANKVFEAWSERDHEHGPKGTVAWSERDHEHGPKGTVVPCFDKKEEKTTITQVTEVSPQTGEVSVQDLRYLPFKYLTRGYPTHRLKNTKSIRAADHKWGKLPPIEQRELLNALDCLVVSPDWLKDSGKWVPNPDRFIDHRELWVSKAKPNHKTEVREIHQIYLEITGQPGSLNQLTPEREESMSHRQDELLVMTSGLPTKPMDIVRDAIKACVESHKKKGVVTTLEHVFGSAENLERWVKKAGYAK